jgi:hypothetical protein
MQDLCQGVYAKPVPGFYAIFVPKATWWDADDRFVADKF